MKSIFNTPFQTSKTGKEHSLRYDELEPDFAKWLRLNYYNIQLHNIDVAELKKTWNN